MKFHAIPEFWGIPQRKSWNSFFQIWIVESWNRLVLPHLSLVSIVESTSFAYFHDSINLSVEHSTPNRGRFHQSSTNRGIYYNFPVGCPEKTVKWKLWWFWWFSYCHFTQDLILSFSYFYSRSRITIFKHIQYLYMTIKWPNVHMAVWDFKINVNYIDYIHYYSIIKKILHHMVCISLQKTSIIQNVS